MNSETINPNLINSAPTQAAESPKKCKHMPIIVVLAVLAVAGIGFGGFELWQNMQKDNHVTVLEAQTTSNSENSNTAEASEIDLKQVRNILNEFIVFDYPVTSVSVDIFGDKGLMEPYKYYLSLKKLNYTDKASAIHDYMPSKDIADYEYSFTYDDINNAYHSLFGSDSDVQNQESVWCFVPFFSTKYNKYVSTNRCGGVDPSIYNYEILNYSTSNNKLTVDIAYIHIREDSPKKYIVFNSGDEEIIGETSFYLSADYLREHEDDLPKYRLTFEKEDSNYIFTDISKL